MHFIQITESVTTEEVTSKAQGLRPLIAQNMENSLTNSKINYIRRGQDCIEAETSGLNMINILIDYRVYGQSMAIEESVIGGRTIKVQKTVWTLGK